MTITIINHGTGSAKIPIQINAIPRPITILSPLHQNISLGTERVRIVLQTRPSERTPPQLFVMSSSQDRQSIKLVKQESGEAWYESDVTFRQPNRYMMAIEKPSSIPGRIEFSFICILVAS
jgi:hypothetical protein